jgi:5-methylcytosine-specific restriction endonuclease McrA
MSVIATALKHMLAAGMDPDAIVAAVAEMENATAPKEPVLTLRQARNTYERSIGVSVKQWRSLRTRVFRRDRFTCVYCGSDVRRAPQCDHVVPLARGGKTALENLATSCKSCNSSKRDLLLEDWRR